LFVFMDGDFSTKRSKRASEEVATNSLVAVQEERRALLPAHTERPDALASKEVVSLGSSLAVPSKGSVERRADSVPKQIPKVELWLRLHINGKEENTEGEDKNSFASHLSSPLLEIWRQSFADIDILCC